MGNRNCSSSSSSAVEVTPVNAASLSNFIKDIILINPLPFREAIKYEKSPSSDEKEQSQKRRRLDTSTGQQYLFVSQYPQDLIDKLRNQIPIHDWEMYENFIIMERNSKYTTKRAFSTSPCRDLRLDPSEVYVGYKLACFDQRNDSSHDIMKNVAVLVTLYIQSSQAFIAEGATGVKVNPNDMKNGTKYCTKRAI